MNDVLGAKAVVEDNDAKIAEFAPSKTVTLYQYPEESPTPPPDTSSVSGHSYFSIDQDCWQQKSEGVSGFAHDDEFVIRAINGFTEIADKAGRWPSSSTGVDASDLYFGKGFDTSEFPTGCQ
ncbi:MAG: hypothetical protein Q9164_000898 [Protoblastenia rupestris]